LFLPETTGGLLIKHTHFPHNLLKEKNHEDGYEEKKPEVDGGKI